MTLFRALAGYVFQTASSVLPTGYGRASLEVTGAITPSIPKTHGDMNFSPEHVFLGRERLAQARAILLELPERTRTVFILRRIEEMSYGEIAT